MHAFMIDSPSSQEALTAPEALKLHLNADMTIVNTIIREKIHSAVALIPHLSTHIIRSGGKRLRPMMAIAAGQIFNPQPSVQLHKLAAAIEFLHTASLLHDDVVDESEMRRNQPSANSIWGNAASVLVGDYILSKGFELIADLHRPEIALMISRAAGRITEGEVMQLSEAHNLSMAQEVYLTIIESKTAELFATGMRAAATLSGASVDCADALYDYGIQVGTMFQLVDDNLDFLMESLELGKRQGADFFEGKVTLPIIMAYERGDEIEQAFWQRTMKEKTFLDGDLATAIQYINKYNIFDEIYTMCYRYAERAQKALGLIPAHPMRDHLFKIIDYCIYRRF